MDEEPNLHVHVFWVWSKVSCVGKEVTYLWRQRKGILPRTDRHGEAKIEFANTGEALVQSFF